MISGRAKQLFGSTFQGAIAVPASRDKVIDHQQRVFGLKGQALDGLGRGSEAGGQAGRIELGSKVLLAKGGQSGLENTAGAREEQTKIQPAQGRSVDGCQQRETEAAGRDRQAPQRGRTAASSAARSSGQPSW